jgi:hypothetical protein
LGVRDVGTTASCNPNQDQQPRNANHRHTHPLLITKGEPLASQKARVGDHAAQLRCHTARVLLRGSTLEGIRAGTITRETISPDERAELDQKLGRMDARSDEPWTHRYLQLIERYPARRAPELAAEITSGMSRSVFSW